MNVALSSVKTRLRTVADAFASVIFPAPCRLCGENLASASRIPICQACILSLAGLQDPMCQRCGRPFVSQVMAESGSGALCHMCRRDLYDFDFARSYGPYTPNMARAIILLKYNEVFPLANWFASRLAGVVARFPEHYAADVVVSVPLHATRLKERGYNQAELIARPLAKQLGLPFRSYLLVRTRPRPDKLRLTIRERWRTVRGSYTTADRTRVDNLRVLLIDDVLTTGATLDACSRALRRAGASKVLTLTVARVALRTEILSAATIARVPNQ